MIYVWFRNCRTVLLSFQFVGIINQICEIRFHNTYYFHSIMKADYPSDAELEARLRGLDYTDPGLRCPADRLIQRLCINSNCKTSLICNQFQCDSCQKIHRKCPTVPLRGLTQSLNEKIGGCKDFVSSVFQIENVLMDELQANRGELIKEFHSSHLNSQHQKIVRKIYEGRDSKDITGKMAKELLDELEQEEEQKKKRSDLLLEEYRKELRALTERLVTAQRRIYQQYSENKEESMELMREMPKEREILVEKRKGDILDSLILTKDKKGEEDFQFLRASLKQPKKIDLLYRGSQNQFRADLFHQKCDNTPDTFTLAKTEFDTVIGGFSHYAWNAVDKGYVNDEGRNAFLLSFHLKQKMVPDSHQNLIFCHPNCGPAFGGGRDLFLVDRCNQNKKFKAKFPTTYNFKWNKRSQESYKAFSGATEGYKFKVLEYEVFRVRYE